MKKSLAFKLLLLAFCAGVESGIITIELPEEDYHLKLANGTIQLNLSTNNSLVSIKVSL